jgi:AraC-like DNA-binding protein
MVGSQHGSCIVDFAGTSRNARVSFAPTIQRIRAAIAADLEEVPTLLELAAAAKTSRYRLSREFRKHVGVCLRDYVRIQRLERACTLLVTSERSLTTIALDCGFYDLAHFDKIFRRRFGVTPGEYQRRYGQRRRLARTRHGGSLPSSRRAAGPSSPKAAAPTPEHGPEPERDDEQPPRGTPCSRPLAAEVLPAEVSAEGLQRSRWIGALSTEPIRASRCLARGRAILDASSVQRV